MGPMFCCQFAMLRFSDSLPEDIAMDPSLSIGEQSLYYLPLGYQAFQDGVFDVSQDEPSHGGFEGKAASPIGMANHHSSFALLCWRSFPCGWSQAVCLKVCTKAPGAPCFLEAINGAMMSPAKGLHWRNYFMPLAVMHGPIAKVGRKCRRIYRHCTALA